MGVAMNSLRKASDTIDRVNRGVAHGVAWLVLIVALGQFGVMVLRHVFDTGFVWQQINLRYINGVFCIMGLAYALLLDRHVRVDIFYRSAGERARAAIDICAAVVFIAPLSVLLFAGSRGYVLGSWAVLEGTSEGAGVPLVFLYKTAIWIAALALFLQAVSMATSAARRFSGPR